MAYNSKKYKDIFEKRYGKGSFDAGLSQARDIGRTKAEAEFAKAAFLDRLNEAKDRAKKEAELRTEYELYGGQSKESWQAKNEAQGKITEQQQKAQAQGRGGHLPSRENKKAQNKAIEDSDKKYGSASKGTLIPHEDMTPYQKQLRGLAPSWDKKKEKEKKKKKGLGGLIDKLKKSEVGQAVKAAKEVLNPFDDVKAKDAINNYLKHEPSKTAKEVQRGANRAVDSASLGLMSNLDKKVNDRQPYYNSSRKIGEGGGTDLLTSGLGYLVPGVGGVKAVRGLGLGAKEAAGAKKFAQIAKEGAIVGGGIGAAEVGIREALNPKDTNYKQNLALFGLSAAGGAIADPLLHGLGGIASKQLGKLAKGDVPNFTGRPSQSTLDQLGPKPFSRASGQTDQFFDRLSASAKQPQPSLRERGLDPLSRSEAAPSVENIRPLSETLPGLNTARSTPREFEPITARNDGGSLIRLKAGETPIDRTPIDIHNPKEIVKKQIDTNGKREKTKWSFDKAYTAVVSDLHAVNKASKDLGGKGLQIEKDPHKLAQLARGMAGKAEAYLNGGVFNEQGQKIEKSLKEIIKPFENKIDDFLAYAISKRALDYDKKGLTAGIKPKNVEGMNDYQLAEATIRQIEAESPNIKAHQQELVKYSQTLMKELKESGYYTDEAVEQIFKDNPNYISMNRVQEPRVRGFEPISPKNKFASLTNPIKQRTGSEKPIINPIESLVKNTYVITNIAERNKVGVALHDLIKNAPENNMWGRVTNVTKQDSSINNLSSVLDDASVQMNDGRTDAIDNLFKGEGNKVYVYKDGQKIEMELQDDLYKAMLSLDAQKQNVFINLMGIPARTLRAGAVLSPDFGPVNIFRDQLSAFVNSKYGFVPFLDMAKGMKSVIKKDSDYWLWKQNGGANSVLSTLDREYLQADLRKMVKQSLGQKMKADFGGPIKTVDTILRPLRKVSEITEEATRVGEFKKGLKKGATPKEAAFSSRDLIDFSRAGSIGRQYNQVTAFFNAAVQSMDKLARTFKERPVQAPIKAITSITLPSIVAYYYNHDKEWYKEIPQREKDLYWHFEAGNQIYKLPKPFEAGVMFGTSFERMLDYAKTNDPKSFEGFGKTVKDAFTPNWIPTAILPWIEAYGNKSMHFDSPIVPRREQDMLPEDQYGPYQSELSKGIGKIANKSPRKIEHVFKGYTGGLGNYFLKGTDGISKLAGNEKPELPDRGLADLPILNRFVVKNLEGNNQSVDDFYKGLDKSKRESLSAKKNGTPNPNENVYKTYNKISSRISDLQAQKRSIIDDPNMGGKQKTEEIKRIDMVITLLAKQAESYSGLGR